jgi:ATP-binding cassette subfamily B protein
MSTSKKTLQLYWQHAKKYKKNITIIYPLMVVAQLLEEVAEPLLVSVIFSKLAAGNIEALKQLNLAVIFLGIAAIEIVSLLLWNVIIRMFWRVQDVIMKDLSMTVFDHLGTMSARFFANRFAGSLVNQSNKFVGSFERLTDALSWNVFKLLVSLVYTTVVLLPRAPIIAIAILILCAIYTPLVWFFRKKQVPYNKRWAAAETKRTGQLADSISNIIAVKSFANETLEHNRMLKRATDVHKQSIATMKHNMNQELLTGFVSRSINISVIILSVALAVNGTVDASTIYLALTFTTGILRRLWDLSNSFRQFTRVFGDANDMTEILQIKPEVSDNNDAVQFEALRGDIVLDKVNFTHDGSQVVLFEDLSLHIKQGEKIGLVGKSGSGKTTFVNLLLRFMDLQSGSIRIDGVDIDKAKQGDVRRSITFVPQEPLLFHRSLAENIAYGDPDATIETIVAAAKMANAHDFIVKLPEGYNTLVGERGVKLSGGQRQRVAIARAIIKNAPILVLDEATSALDSESEALIQDALWKLIDKKTAIVIAHRLSTIQKMDRILVMDKGEIVEQGSHRQLLKNKNGTYSKLWLHQSGGFLED